MFGNMSQRHHIEIPSSGGSPAHFDLKIGRSNYILWWLLLGGRATPSNIQTYTNYIIFSRFATNKNATNHLENKPENCQHFPVSSVSNTKFRLSWVTRGIRWLSTRKNGHLKKTSPGGHRGCRVGEMAFVLVRLGEDGGWKHQMIQV